MNANEKAANRRQYTRARTRIAASIETAEGTTVCGVVRDVSLRGAFIEIDEDVKAGSECQVSLVLIGLENPVSIKASARVVRVEALGAGLLFTRIKLDDFYHLRRLVDYNGGSHEAQDP